MVVGLNALWVAPVFGPISQSILVLLPVAALASLLPDLDATSAKIHYIGGGTLGVFRGAFFGKYFHHRGLLHSLPFTFLLWVLLLIIFHASNPALAFVFALSYASHGIIDGFNSSVGYLYPFVRKSFALVPRSFRTPVGGIVDGFLFFAALMGVLAFLILYKDQFFPASAGF